MKTIQGYIRDIPGGDGLPGITVTARHQSSGLTVASGGMTKCTTNPVNTDADGFFTWECELSPGPVKIDATISGGQKKVRSGLEMMQAGDVWVSDFSEYMKVLTSGVISGEANEFSITIAGMNLTLKPGSAIMEGRLFQTETDRVIAVGSNVSVAVRWDLLVFQQYISGTNVGKQDIVLLQGGNSTDPVLNSNPAIYEQAMYRVKVANGASTFTTDDLRAYSTILINNNQIGMSKLDAGGQLSTSDTAKVLKAPTSGLTPAFASVSLHELNDVFLSSLSAGHILAWDAADSRFENVVHDHSAQYSVIGHTHAHSALTGLDTDASTSALHHTLGTGANQAAAGNHTHAGGTPTAHAASHVAGSTDPLTGSLDATARTAVREGGVLVGTRRGINFISGGGITIGSADNSGSERVDLTFTGLEIGSGALTAAAGNHNHNATYAALSHSHTTPSTRIDVATASYAEKATVADLSLASGSMTLSNGVTYDIEMVAIVQGHMRTGNVGNAQVGVRWESEATIWGSQVGTEEGERPLVGMGAVAGIVGNGGTYSYSMRGRTTGGAGTSEFYGGQIMVVAHPRQTN